MKKIKILLFLFLSFHLLNAQNPIRFIDSKDYSMEYAEFLSKKYLIDEVLDSSKNPVQFEVETLIATTSMGLVSIWYRCTQQKKEGLVLGFFETYINEKGTMVTGYRFKDFSKAAANDFFNTIDTIAKNHEKWFNEYGLDKNIYFNYDDLKLIMYNSKTEFSMEVRIFWGPFDVTWEFSPYDQTKKRLLKKMNGG